MKTISIDPNPDSNKRSANRVAQKLVVTLQQTEVELDHLKVVLVDQLEALRDRSADRLHGTTERMASVSRNLKRLVSAKMRQTELIASVLGVDNQSVDLDALAAALDSDEESIEELRRVEKRIRERARDTHKLYEDLAFALHFASKLESDLVRAVVNLSAPDESVVYNANGNTEQTRTGNSMLNQIG